MNCRVCQQGIVFIKDLDRNMSAAVHDHDDLSKVLHPAEHYMNYSESRQRRLRRVLEDKCRAGERV